jgi:hypothetical protein
MYPRVIHIPNDHMDATRLYVRQDLKLISNTKIYIYTYKNNSKLTTMKYMSMTKMSRKIKFPQGDDTSLSLSAMEPRLKL